MAKEDILIINGWQAGMGQSALDGFYMIKNCDINENGVIRPNYRLIQVSGTGGDLVEGTVVGMDTDPSDNSKVYAVVQDGTSAALFRSTDSGATWLKMTLGGGGSFTNLSPLGMRIYKSYLFVFYAKKIDVVKLSDLTITNDWTTDGFGDTGDATYHPSIIGADDIMYIGNGRYICTISETLGDTFDPTDSASYSINDAALDLPSTARIRTIDWLNNGIIMGTWNGLSNIEAGIYTWNGTDASYKSPIKLSEAGIRAGITIGQLFYFFVGGRCDLYATDGNQAFFVKHLPREILNILSSTGTVDIKPQAIMHRGNKIFFGLRSGAVTTGQLRGVWSYDLETGAFVYENEISTGNDGTDAYLSIDVLLNFNSSTFFVAWYDATTPSYGIDKNDTNRYSNYGAVIQTLLYKVGSKTNKKTFNNLEAQFARVFSSDAFRVGYRTNLTASFTTITNLTTTADGTVSLEDGTPLTDLENLQLQIEMSNNASLIELRLK